MANITQSSVGELGDIIQCCVGYKSHITLYYPYRGKGRLRIIQYGRERKCLGEIPP